MADFGSAVREIIGIDANTVAADKAGAEIEKIPFGSRRIEHIPDRKVEPGKRSA